jgi:hypothetical protein
LLAKLELTVVEPLMGLLSTGYQPCPQILELGGFEWTATNTLAY